MSLPKEFKSADQVHFEDWEKVHSRQFSDVLRLFDVAMVQAKENAGEGWGFTSEAVVGGCQVKLSVAPPPRTGSGFGGKGSQPVFSRERVQAVVMENPDLSASRRRVGRSRYPRRSTWIRSGRASTGGSVRRV